MKQNQLLLKTLTRIVNNKIPNNYVQQIINNSDNALVKQKKCGVCNKKYESNNRYYGSSCVKNLLKKASVNDLKEIDDKELYLYSTILLRLQKYDLRPEQINYVCESYLSKLYFNQLKFGNLNKLDSKFEYYINNNKKPMMKLNTAYRISNILKRNNKKLRHLNDIDLDKRVDENIISFLKTYFSLKKIKNPIYYEICYYMQLVIFEAVVVGGIFKKHEFSSNCLRHSISVIGENPKDLVYTNKDRNLITMIKEDIKFQKRIKSIIKQYQKDDKIIFNEDIENKAVDSIFTFEDNKDLFYSLHSVTISVCGEKRQDKWDLNIKIIDRYDFTEILSNDKYTKHSKKYITLGNVLNDIATVSTVYGVLKPYNITIKLHWSDFNEK